MVSSSISAVIGPEHVMGEPATDLPHQTQEPVLVDRTAFYKRGPLDAPSTRHRGHKNKPLILVAELEADAVF